MSLRSELESGRHGVRLRLPSAWPTVQENPYAFTVKCDGVALFVAELPWPVSFEPDQLAAIRADAEVEARDWLARETERDKGHDPKRPRTRGETAPLVECEVMGDPGAHFLRVVHRLAMRPGREVVQGVLVVPMGDAALQLRWVARDDMTGLRETVLVEKALRNAGQLDQAAMQRLLAEIPFDDPRYDADFPKHALSRVRIPQRALLEGREGSLSVEPRAPRPDDAEVELPSAFSALRVPPRFRYVAPEVMRMSRGMNTFTKLTFAPTPRMAELWWSGEQARDGESLERYARRTVESWANEGAQDIAIETRAPRPLDSTDPALAGATQLDLDVRFRSNGDGVQGRQRWIALASGDVLRLAVSASPGFTAEDLEKELDLMTRSLRIVDPPSRAQPRPWWRFW